MYLNYSSQVVSAASAGKTFVVDTTIQNYDNCAFQFAWTGVTGTAGFVQLYGSIDGSNFSTFPVATGNNPATLTTSTSSYLFNISDASYNWVRTEYQPGGNATGTVNLFTTRKSRK